MILQGMTTPIRGHYMEPIQKMHDFWVEILEKYHTWPRWGRKMDQQQHFLLRRTYILPETNCNFIAPGKTMVGPNDSFLFGGFGQFSGFREGRFLAYKSWGRKSPIDSRGGKLSVRGRSRKNFAGDRFMSSHLKNDGNPCNGYINHYYSFLILKVPHYKHMYVINNWCFPIGWLPLLMVALGWWVYPVDRSDRIWRSLSPKIHWVSCRMF